MPFTVASYNVLATVYVPNARYRRTPTMVLDPAWRVPALVQYITNLATDVVCLQEVELATFAALKSRLTSLGYGAQYRRKTGGKPDGCATFYRQEVFEFLGARVFAYANEAGAADDSGDIALLVVLRSAEGVVAIANTHLGWEPYAIPEETRAAVQKIRQLLAECERLTEQCQGWLICGDLNVTPDSEVVAILQRAGFRYAHRDLAETYTCNVNAEAKMIDYLFHSPALRSEPEAVLRISDQTSLPSVEQPSDHLPIVARFYWRI